MALPFFFLSLLLLLSGQTNAQLGMGINYGQLADNLPTPTRVAALLNSINVTRVKLYDANPAVLSAFADTGIELVVGLANLSNITDAAAAQDWIQTHIQPYIARTRITSITVGNEILTGSDSSLMSLLLPAMQSVYSALSQLGLSDQVSVTTASSTGILATSYPPSSGSFRPELAQYIQPLLNFHSKAKSPLLINAYPFFAYMGDSTQVSLNYALFKSNPGITDPGTGLHYDNMLYAEIDAVYSAMRVMGHTDIAVQISETGWPSKGDPDELGATPENAAAYNGNLLKRIQNKEGTPAKPTTPIDVYVFALFNEDDKTGATSERNYGLYYPDETPVYSIGIGLQGNQPEFVTNNYSSASRRRLRLMVRITVLIMAITLLHYMPTTL